MSADSLTQLKQVMCDAAVHVAKCLAIELFNKLSAIKFFLTNLPLSSQTFMVELPI
jgi:hypothetical protein